MSHRTRKFKLEEEMAYHVRTWLEISGFATKMEYRTPWGICDIVGVQFDSEYVRSRQLLRQAPVGSIQRVALLEVIPTKESIPFAEVLKSTDNLFTDSELSEELEHLRKHHFVEATSSGQFRRIAPAWAKRNRIIAVEMKLDRLEEVISQAISNLTLAHHSYVALPDQNASRLAQSARADELAKIGIGILGVERGGCDILLESKGDRRRAIAAVQAHCIERFWRSLIGKTS